MQFKFILNAYINDHNYQTPLYFNLTQWTSHCRNWMEENCDICLDGYNKVYYKWEKYPKKIIMFFFIDWALVITLLWLFICGVLKKIKWYVYLSAWNHYQTYLMIFSFLPSSARVLSMMISISLIISPYSIVLAPIRMGFLYYFKSNIDYNDFDEYITPNDKLLTTFCLWLFVFVWYSTLVIIHASLRKIDDYFTLKYCYAVWKDHSTTFSLWLFFISSYFLRTGVKFINYEVQLIPPPGSLNIFFVFFIVIVLIWDISAFIKVYIRKLFDILYEKDWIWDWYFEGLNRDPYALPYHLFNQARRAFFVVIFWICSYFRNLLIFILFCPYSLLLIESLWLCYWVHEMPFKSLSMNRIEIINQILVVASWISCSISCTWIYCFYSPSQDSIASIILTINEIFYAVCLFPTSYILIGLQNIIIHWLYIKKGNTSYPRYWKMKNPNLRYASEDELTEYMPILINN